MANTSWRYKMHLFTMAVLVALGSATAGAVQYIDAGTPAPTEESSGGGWGELLPNRDRTQSTQIEGDIFVLPSSGAEVVIADGVTVTSEETQVEDQIIFESDFGLGAIAVIGILSTPEDVRDNYVAGFGESMESIDEIEVDSARAEASGIYVFMQNGLPLYMYISVDGATMPGYMVIEVFIGEPDNMSEGIALSRDNITVSDVAMFSDIDEQQIEDVIVREEG